MNKILRSLLLLAMSLAAVAGVYAQDQKPVDLTPAKEGVADPAPDTRGSLLKQLGLTRPQAMALKRLNGDRKPLMEAAQAKLRAANRALDQAIYADQVSDAEVQARLKDVHTAQNEVVRIRAMNELAVRRVLTPEQLGRFRQLRQQFEEAQQNAQREGLPMKRRAGRPGPVPFPVKQGGAKPNP